MTSARWFQSRAASVPDGSFPELPHTARNEPKIFPVRYRQATLLTAGVSDGSFPALPHTARNDRGHSEFLEVSIGGCGSSLVIPHAARNEREKPPVAGGGRSRRYGCRAGVVGGGVAARKASLGEDVGSSSTEYTGGEMTPLRSTLPLCAGEMGEMGVNIRQSSTQCGAAFPLYALVLPPSGGNFPRLATK